MFSVIKSLVALNAIFLLVVSASPVKIAGGGPASFEAKGITEIGVEKCSHHNGKPAIYVKRGGILEWKDCPTGTTYVLDPARFSSFDILRMFSRCEVQNGKPSCVTRK